MKKIPLILSLILVLCLILSSCNNIGNPDTSNDSNTDTNSNAGTSSSIDASNDTDIETVKPLEPYEKYGNKVYFALEEKKTNYYVTVTNKNESEESDISSDEKLEENYEKNIIAPAEIPKDGKNYFKFIETYEELTTYISSPNVDSSVLENNYIICIKENFYLSSGWEKYFKHLGYSDFKFTDNEYEISRNCYFSVEYGREHIDILEPITMVNYLIIPKTEIDFVEGVQKISVKHNQINGDNGLWTDEFLGGNKNPMPPSTDTHNALTHNEKAVLPNVATAWVIEKESELERQLGLEPNDYFELDYRVIIYLPIEPKYDFIITEKVIKNGNLYLTVEEYSQYTNEYLNKNDVKFYDLYIQDTSELAENFDVYLLIKSINMNTDTSINTNDNSTNSSDTNNNNTSSST